MAWYLHHICDRGDGYMPIYGIIADDLTGACDTAVQFAEKGYKSGVLLHSQNIQDFNVDEFEAIAVATDSRNAAVNEAYHRVKDACHLLQELGVKKVYKKIDSTWRGHIGLEVETVMDQLGYSLCIICSSYPANKRIVVGGYLLVDGRPVEKTPLATDPIFPITESYMLKYLGKQTKLPIEPLDLQTVFNLDQMIEKIDAYLKGPPTILVADGVTDHDLHTLSELESVFPNKILFCGSAGMASSWLFHLQNQHPLKKTYKSVLTIVGSTNSANIDQMEHFTSNKQTALVFMDPKAALSQEDNRSLYIDSTVCSIVDHLRIGKDVVLTTYRSSMDLIKDNGNCPVSSFRQIGKELGRITDQVLRQIPIEGLVITGGDTAIEILQALGATGICVEAEIMPGIPIGRIIGGKYQDIPIVTKAGGFGGQGALSYAVRHLKKIHR
ncbi:MAG: four-carbon acid sugar kinase family protein [Bacillota bacterium]